MAVNLGITHLPLGSMLQAELGVPIFVEHDARAAALWLSRQAADGSAHAPASIAFLAIGTGISAGIVLDGAVLRGDNNFAGEVGHLVADPDGVVCACGLRGCLETIAAGPAIARQAAEAIAAGRSTILSPDASAGDVFRAASAGDEVALEITDRVADHLARAIRSLALTLGVKRVVIGGGVAAAGPALLDPIRRASSANARTRHLSRPPWAMPASSCCRPPKRLARAGRRRSLATASACLSERGWANDNLRGAFSGVGYHAWTQGANRQPQSGQFAQEEEFMGNRLRTTPALAVDRRPAGQCMREQQHVAVGISRGERGRQRGGDARPHRPRRARPPRRPRRLPRWQPSRRSRRATPSLTRHSAPTASAVHRQDRFHPDPVDRWRGHELRCRRRRLRRRRPASRSRSTASARATRPC